MSDPLPGRSLRKLQDLAAPLPVEPEVPPRTRLGKYEVVHEIARGAMGVLSEAVDTAIGRPVALKILRDFAGLNEIVRLRFQREAQAAGTLSHPNVVRVYDAGEDAGRMYLVMELVQGRPLSEILGG